MDLYSILSSAVSAPNLPCKQGPTTTVVVQVLLVQFALDTCGAVALIYTADYYYYTVAYYYYQ